MNEEKVFVTLDKLLNIRSDFTIIQGGARGADAAAFRWAALRNIPCETFHADWNKYKHAAGPIRNKQMIDSGIDLLVAFPGGKGTTNMIEQCIYHEIRTMIIAD